MFNNCRNKVVHIFRFIYQKLKTFIFLCRCSIRYKFIITIILIVLLPLGFSFVFIYENTYTILRENASKSLVDSVKILNNDIITKLDIINNTSMLFLSNPTIRYNLSIDADDEMVAAQKRININRELENLLIFNYAWDNQILKSVFVYENPSTYYTISKGAVREDIIQKSIKVGQTLYSSNNMKQLIPPSQEDQTIYFARNTYDLNTQHYLGTIILGIDANSLSEVNKSLVKYEGIIITTFDEHGIIFAGTDTEMLGKKVDDRFFALRNTQDIHNIDIDGRSYLILASSMEDYNLNSIVAIPRDEVFQNLNSQMSQYMVTIIISIALSLIFGIYISSKVIKPISTLTEVTAKVRDGNYNQKLPRSKYIELDQLNIVFNKAIDQIDYLVHQVYEKQLLLKDSEMAMLQSQIQPHFLFNVLETIGWEARFSNNMKIYNMISSLSQLIRSSISLSGHEQITIGEELKYIELYLILQKMRFEDRLAYNIKVESEDLRNYMLPKLCILPIVENAVVHGLEAKRDGGFINIEIRKFESNILIEVIDDGIGFDPSIINLDSPIYENPEGLNKNYCLGLYNSNRRIKLMYGCEFGLSIESCKNKGTRVSVLIPRGEGRNADV